MIPLLIPVIGGFTGYLSAGSKKFAKGGMVDNFPPKGELKNKDNFLLKYEKKGSDYEFFVYKPTKKGVNSYEQVKYVCVNKDCPTRMSYNQFINYLYAELYLDDREYAKGGEIDLFQDVKSFKKGGNVNDKLKKDAEFYFSDKYNLTKHQLREDLVRYVQQKNNLITGKIKPSDVIGTGYKNPAPIARDWLDHQIELTKYLITNFDKENKLTESQKKELEAQQKPKVSNAMVKRFLPKHQWWILDNDEFTDVVDHLKSVIADMPKTYETDSIKTPEKVVYLHYFYGSMDWYIVERDMEEEQLQAFGKADFGHGGEWGYINIEELVNSGKIELDLYFEPKKVKDID